MLNRSCVILCPNCRRQSTILVPLVNEIVKTISCPQCGCEGLLLADFFTPIGEKIKNMTPEEIREVVVEIFTALGEKAASAINGILSQNKHPNKPPDKTPQITEEEVQEFKGALNSLDNKKTFDSIFGTGGE